MLKLRFGRMWSEDDDMEALDSMLEWATMASDWQTVSCNILDSVKDGPIMSAAE